jgi:hypothetical protein
MKDELEDDGGGGGGGMSNEDHGGGDGVCVLVNGGCSPSRVPLKTILSNFLSHVSTLEAQKNDGENTYEKEFQVRKIRASWGATILNILPY